jgi:NAD(P)H-hydrate epimerase
MLPVVTADEMRKIDAETIKKHVPGIELMENAGRGVKEAIAARYEPRKGAAVVVVCGKGNNGGDGFVIARLLKQDGYGVKVFLLGKAKDLKGDALTNYKRLRKLRTPVKEIAAAGLPALEKALAGAYVVVDAVFGTGFSGEARGVAAGAIGAMNEVEAPVIAVDIASGVDATTGQALNAVAADLTVTMALPKRGHVLHPGRALTGELNVVDIGVPADVVAGHDPGVYFMQPEDIGGALPVRPPDAHKWSCGSVAAVCGSTGFTGAAALTATSALRAGAGLVTLAVPKSLNTIMEVKLTEVMTMPVAETRDGSFALKAATRIKKLIENADTVAIGPGLSLNKETQQLVRRLIPKMGRPTVLDADGINALAGKARKIKHLDFPLVITPHAGELSRLTGIDKEVIGMERIDAARYVATELGLVVLLKGAPTVVAEPQGGVFVNPTGNEGLATAGSGDVLTGVIAGFMAQGVDPVPAACCGAYIHGLAADMLRENMGPYGFLAGDVRDMIPMAIASLLEE